MTIRENKWVQREKIKKRGGGGGKIRPPKNFPPFGCKIDFSARGGGIIHLHKKTPVNILSELVVALFFSRYLVMPNPFF